MGVGLGFACGGVVSLVSEGGVVGGRIISAAASFDFDLTASSEDVITPRVVTIGKPRCTPPQQRRTCLHGPRCLRAQLASRAVTATHRKHARMRWGQ